VTHRSLSAPGGGEGRGEVGDSGARAGAPASPSHRCATGPSLSPQRADRGDDRRAKRTPWSVRTTMTTRPDKPKEYFAKLLDLPEEEIDYSEIPATAAADWQDAEVLLAVTPEEFRAIKQFLQHRRGRNDIGA
jgi:hypothetical protein